MTDNYSEGVILLNLLHDFPIARHILRLANAVKILNVRMGISRQTCSNSLFVLFS